MYKWLGLFALFFATSTSGQVVLGREVVAEVSFCPTREIAEEIALVHQKRGIELASELFGALCVSGMVNVIPINLLRRFPTKEGDLKIISGAVLLKDKTRRVFYILTTSLINGDI